jgi:hypothetical protein
MTLPFVIGKWLKTSRKQKPMAVYMAMIIYEQAIKASVLPMQIHKIRSVVVSVWTDLWREIS